MKWRLMPLLGSIIILGSTPTLQADAPGSEAATLDQIMAKTSELQWGPYRVTRYQDENGAWNAELTRDGSLIQKFEYGGPWPATCRFGTHPLLGYDASQLLVEQFSGGAHCCWSYWVFARAPYFHIIYQSRDYPVGYSLMLYDLDQDGVLELTQSLLTFDYFDGLCHACSPLPPVVFAFDSAGFGYRPANPRFADWLLKGIQDDINNVRQLRAEAEQGDRYAQQAYLGAVLQVVLQYLYAGRHQDGWAFFDQMYHEPDRSKIKQEIMATLDECKVYQELFRSVDSAFPGHSSEPCTAGNQR